MSKVARWRFNIIMATLSDVQAAVATVDTKIDAVGVKVDTLIAGGGSQDLQPVVDTVTALGTKLDAIQAK